MDALTYSRARQDLAQTMDKVCKNHKPVIITGEIGLGRTYEP